MQVGDEGVQLRADAGEVREADPRLPCWWAEFEKAVRIAVLLNDPMKAVTTTREEALALLVAIAPMREALRVAAVAAEAIVAAVPEEKPAPMLALAQVAERSGLSIRWWRTHWRVEIPSATRKGRTVLVPVEEFEKWRRK